MNIIETARHYLKSIFGHSGHGSRLQFYVASFVLFVGFFATFLLLPAPDFFWTNGLFARLILLSFYAFLLAYFVAAAKRRSNDTGSRKAVHNLIKAFVIFASTLIVLTAIAIITRQGSGFMIMTEIFYQPWLAVILFLLWIPLNVLFARKTVIDDKQPNQVPPQ